MCGTLKDLRLVRERARLNIMGNLIMPRGTTNRQTTDSVVRLAIARPHSPSGRSNTSQKIGPTNATKDVTFDTLPGNSKYVKISELDLVLVIPPMGHMVPASTLVPLTKNVSNDLAELLNNASPTNPTQPATALPSPQVIVSAVVVINS